MNRTVVLNVAGLTRSLLGEHTPCLSRFSGAADIDPLLPAVTCTMQSTYLTGLPPAGHGIVGNGWFFRELSEVFFWRQSNRLVQGEKIWQLARRRDSSFTCANSFWWYAMDTEADWSVTPRPIYCADGSKIPDCYSWPPHLRKEFTDSLGPFPLFDFWGPRTSIRSSRWIASAARRIEEMFGPSLHLVYLPHLDYVLQREGPSGEMGKDLSEIDALCGELIDFFRERGCRVVVLSEYGITDVRRVVHPNRILREAGFLTVKEDLGRDYLDTYGSRAFAVADHQIAHLYLRNLRDISAVQELFERTPGVETVLAAEGKRQAGLDHARAGDLVLVAERDTWFSYYFWEEDLRAPDYARSVDIHSKPGYDPCELFLDPAIRFPRLKVASLLLRRKAGLRTVVEVIPLDAGLVKGSHGRPTERPEDGPLFMTTNPELLPGSRIKATEVCGLLLDHLSA
jgi:predicted AlkP superfamily pyrophosphatase or phosphodiesterase